MKMELADEIREMQDKKDPIDTEWLKEAISEYFQVCTTRKMYIGLNNAIKEPRRTPIGKTVYKYDIPITWKMRVLQWATKEGFIATRRHGGIILEI